jgi:exonuclease SbcC
MKLQTIEIEGFGPFKDKQFIDFTKFDDHGLFLIAGETGVGKSSILDAITYALYEFTPRWADSNANAEHKSVRSNYCEPTDQTRVKLDFSLQTGGETKYYEIERSINGLDKHGAERKTEVELRERFTDGTHKGIASGKTAVGSAISQLIRLDGNEFLQVALLAQGKFEAFLTASSTKRLELIRKLFNTRRFELIQKEVEIRQAEVKKEVAGIVQQVATAVDGLSQSLEATAPSRGDEISWLKSQVTAYEAEATLKEQEVEQSRQAQAQAQQAFDDATTLEELNVLKEEQRTHESLGKAHQVNLAAINLAERASKVTPFFESLVAAKTDEEQAAAALKALKVPKNQTKEISELKSLKSEVSKKIGALSPVIAAEENLPKTQGAVSALEAEIDTLVAEETDTKLEIEALKAERTSTKKLADSLGTLESKYKEAQDAMESFDEFVDLKEKYEAALVKASKAKSAEDEARSKFETIFRSYSANAAHRLAVNLVDGDACPVCGSQEHPLKAQASGDEVSEADLEAAKTTLETRMLKHQEINGENSLLAEQINKLSDTHAGQNQVSLQAALTVAEAKFVEATEAKNRFDEITTLLELDSEFMVEYTSLSGKIVQLRAEVTSKERELATAEQLVKRNLNGFDSVANYKGSLENHSSDLDLLIEAITALDTATSDLKKAESRLSKALKDQSFASEKDFKSSVLDDEVFEALKVEVARHIDEGTRLRTLMGQEKFSALPKKTIPKAEAESALKDAVEEYSVSVSELAVLNNKLNLIRECQKRLKSILPTLEKQSANLELHRGLYDALHGLGANTLQMTLETYFAASELEVILEAANRQLKTMAAGSQFTLVHSDKALKKSGTAGLGIEVIDEHSGGLRNPVTLSGGEKFQVSLAIALGLAQVVSERSGSIRIDTLFVDEGFGSLSKNVLETAMNTLDALKQGGRTIGVISHVDKMQETIEAKLHVAKVPGGPSFVKAIDA